MMIFGLLIGITTRASFLSFTYQYIDIAAIDPHFMLFIFLPILIFESAFVMDIHIFKKTLLQSFTLAGPGLLISTFLSALMARYIFTYNWTWVMALLFGSILSATDPVAVVALLNELGKNTGVKIQS